MGKFKGIITRASEAFNSPQAKKSNIDSIKTAIAVDAFASRAMITQRLLQEVEKNGEIREEISKEVTIGEIKEHFYRDLHNDGHDEIGDTEENEL